jgi:hypothetical protein
MTKRVQQLGKRRRAQAAQPMTRLPQLKSNIQVSHVYRFVSSTNPTKLSITSASILGAIGVFVTSSTTAVPIAESFKISKLVVMTVGGTNTSTVAVQWYAGANFASSTIEVSDSSLSTTVPAYVVTRPPKGSISSFWVNGADSVPMFEISGGEVTYIDLHVSYVLADASFTPPTITLTSSPTPGELYYLALDGPSSNILVPVSLVTTH